MANGIYWSFKWACSVKRMVGRATRTSGRKYFVEVSHLVEASTRRRVLRPLNKCQRLQLPIPLSGQVHASL
jgi:hypothetical protein